jgi:PAS domain S-box-containing protein
MNLKSEVIAAESNHSDYHAQRDLAELLETMHEGFYSVDRNWIITRVNSYHERISGLSRQQQIGKNLFNVFSSSIDLTQSTYFQKLTEVMEHRVSSNVEIYLPSQMIWIALRIYPKGNEGLAVFYMDVTERKKAEEALILEKHKLEAIFQDSPAAMALWQGQDLHFEKINPEYQKIFENRRLEGPISEALPEIVAQGFPDVLRNVLNTGEPFVGHEVLAKIGKDDGGKLEDRYYDFTYLRINDANGNPYGVYDHAVDVTDRVKARLSLEESESKLRLALQTGRIGFYDLNLLTQQVVCSEQMHKDWGMEKRDYHDLDSMLKQIHPEDLSSVVSKIEGALKSGEPYFIQYRVIKPDNNTVWIEAHGQVSYDEQGQPIRFFGTSVDITDTRNAGEELRQAKENAERASQTKSFFLANMSHEIRTPLGVILGYSDLLKDDGLDDSERKSYLDTISRNGKALTRIIDDILDLAKVESGKLETEEIEFSLCDLVNDIMDLFRETVKAKGIQLLLTHSNDIPKRIVSDPTRLRQILINIVGNAVKFTEEGQVDVCIGSNDHSDGKRAFKVKIVDSGVGISPDQRDKLFQPFVQADNSMTRRYGGTGLGLVLSQRLAKALGGDVNLMDENDSKGACFEFTFVADVPPELEVSKAVELVRNSNANKVALPLSGVNILLAEDSPDNQLLIRRVLLKNGATVDSAVNGVEAFRMGLMGDYDLVLMDIQMPYMDGYEATKALREAGFHKPIIALTAHAMAEERARTHAAGCNGHLTKPLNAKELLETISRNVQQS